MAKLNERNSVPRDHVWQAVEPKTLVPGQQVAWQTDAGRRFGQFTGQYSKNGSAWLVIGGTLMPQERLTVPVDRLLTNGKVTEALPSTYHMKHVTSSVLRTKS